jgi:hypothetical protein
MWSATNDKWGHLSVMVRFFSKMDWEIFYPYSVLLHPIEHWKVCVDPLNRLVQIKPVSMHK